MLINEYWFRELYLGLKVAASFFSGTQETTMARVQARPTTLYQTACCTPIGRSVPAP